MRLDRGPRAWRGSVILAMVGAVACSLQDFDYLQSGGLGGSGTGGTAGGRAGAGGGGAPTTGGAAGSGLGGSAGTGDAGDAGASGTGQAAGAAGAAGEGGMGGLWASAGEGGQAGAAGDGTGGAQGGTSGGTAGMPNGGTGGQRVLLVNGGFESNYTGWTFAPAEAKGTFAYVQWPPQGATNVEGKFELSTWAESAAFTVDISQSVTGLSDGKYTFKGWFNRGDGFNAIYLFARDCGGEDRQENVPLTAATQWLEVGIGGIDVVGGGCEVGFFVDSNPANWLNADAFSFEQDPQ